jgi:hypothetical protein
LTLLIKKILGDEQERFGRTGMRESNESGRKFGCMFDFIFKGFIDSRNV